MLAIDSTSKREMSGDVNKLADRLPGLVRRRGFRFILIALIHGVILLCSLWLAYQLRFDFFVDENPQELAYRVQILRVAAWILPLKLTVFFLFKQYSGLLSYFGTPDLYRLGRAVCVCSALVGLIRLQTEGLLVPPRGVVLIDFLLTFGMVASFRIGCRVIRETFARPVGGGIGTDSARIAIIGAGDVGANLAKELLNRRGLGRLPVVFLDDDPRKYETSIHNVRVAGPPDQIEQYRAEYRVDEVVIAMPSAQPKRIGEIVRLLNRLHIKSVTVPSLDQLTTGKVRLSQLRPIEIQDLLGREPVAIEREEIARLLQGKVVLVTGAGGSIGSELCRQAASFNPERLLLLDQSEFLLFQIEQELIESGYSGVELPLIANILDEARMDRILERYRPDVIFHAAALKHVPMVEAQPLEAVKVNALGTALLANLAKKHMVSQFVMISTDKAINPTSVMGATKRLAEIYIQSLYAQDPENSPAFMAVRFGNVLGSSGSVVPIFKKQIAMGGPVKVTHAEVTRYFMTIPEAVGLVLQCTIQGRGGGIYVLDMGEPIRIVDLARQMIELSGFQPDEDIQIEFTGLRPGEKLFEELQHEGENMEESNHQKIRRFVCEASAMEEVTLVFEELREGTKKGDARDLKMTLRRAVPEYRPYLDEA